MNIDFTELTGEKLKIYKHIWENNSFSADVILSGKQDHSYEFFNVTNEVSYKIGEIFELSNKKVFYKKFEMACSGNGDEIKKITRLHSSSLCALLFFYNVNQKNRLTIQTPELQEYEFYDSLFEVKNKVIKSPSNIDVVLIGESKLDKDKKILLFLESKFSEFITGIKGKGQKYKIGSGYFKCDTNKIYCENVLSQFGIKIQKSQDNYYLIPDQDKYVEGIKQIVSHHLGIRNFLKSGLDNKNEDEVKEKIHKLPKDKLTVYLGEIVFDNFTQEQLKKLNDYESDYQKISKILNETYKDSNMKVLDETLRYSLFTHNNFELDPKVAQFYNIK